MKSLQEHLNNTSSFNEAISKPNLRKLSSDFTQLNVALTNLLGTINDLGGYDEDALNDLIAGKKYPFKQSLGDEIIDFRRNMAAIEVLINKK